MLIYNDKEMESEYCLSDDMLVVINSPVPLSEIFEMLQRGEDIDTERINIRAYMNGDGKARLCSDNMPDKAPYNAGGILSDEAISDIEEAMVASNGYGLRKGLFKAYESYQWNNKIDGYDLKAVNLHMEKPAFKELVRRHIALSSGVMPTLFDERDKSLKELVAMSNMGNDLFRNFGPAYVAKDNPLPTSEQIEEYSRFTEYEKQLVRKNNIPPLKVLEFKKALETSACKGAVITADIYERLKRADVPGVVSERISEKTADYIEKVKAEFKKQYGFDRSPIIPEFITALLIINGGRNLSDANIEKAVASFNRNSMQTVVHSYIEEGKDKETKITVAQTRNPALIWLGTQIPLQEMPQQMLRALATYVTPSNILTLKNKGFMEWIKAHKNDSIANVVKVLTEQSKIEKFDISMDAIHLYHVAENKEADHDRKKYEERYNYKFSDNELAIRGRNIVVEQGPYKVRMLKPDDLKNYIVGYKTNCCQHFGDAGEVCVWHYTKDPFAGCVVVEDKKGQILAQAYVWTDEAKDIFVFDNIEYAGEGYGSDNKIAAKYTNIIEAYVEALPYKNVHLGMGYTSASAWNGIGNTITSKDAPATFPSTVTACHKRDVVGGPGISVYSDYHVNVGSSSARILKKEDGRSHQAKMIKYTVNTNGLRITDPGDEPTRWDTLASKEFAFMLNDYSKSIEERIQLAESFKDNPDKALQMRVVATNPEAILSLENPDPEAQIYVYEHKKDVARMIQNPCVELQQKFVEEDPSYLKTISNPDPALIQGALQTNGLLINMLEHPTIEQAMTAVSQNGYAYRFLPEDILTEEVKMAAVVQAPKVASLLKNPSPEIQLEACRIDPNVMLLLNKPTLSAQMAAVNRKPELVLQMKSPSEPVVRVAVEHNPAMIRKFQYQYPELRMSAIQQNGFIIRDLRDVTMEEYNAAVAQNPDVARLIPSPEAQTRASLGFATGMEDPEDVGIDL